MLLVNFEGMEYTLFVNDERASIFTGVLPHKRGHPTEIPLSERNSPLPHKRGHHGASHGNEQKEH